MKQSTAIVSPLFRVLLAVAVTGGSVSAPRLAYAQWWKDHDGCLVYEHRDFRGKSLVVDAGYTYSYVGGKWNDRISSWVCEVYCRLTVWEHRDYGGATWTAESSRYVGSFWNDRISSMEATCDP